MKRSFRLSAAILIVAVMFLTVLTACDGSGKDQKPEYDPDRFVTITLHAGKNGTFGAEKTETIETVQFRWDTFSETVQPNPINDSEVFIGWASEPDATEPNITPELTLVTDIGSDVYAVWTDEVEVTYSTTDGYYEVDGAYYGQIFMTYKVGARFQNLIPTPGSEQLKFVGWYTDYNGQGEQYTENTVINKTGIILYAQYVADDDMVIKAALDQNYPLTVNGGGQIFSFVPQENAVYNAYTTDMIEEDFTNGYIRLLNPDMTQIQDSIVYDYNGNASLVYELEAGKQYYYQVREANTDYAEMTFRISKVDNPVTVTLHANADEPEDTNFDNVAGKIEKTVRFAPDANVQAYGHQGLTVNKTYKYRFMGWSVNPDSPFPDTFIKATDGMDLYAVYDRSENLILNANGGNFSFYNEGEIHHYSYLEGDYFVTEVEPKIDDVRLKFSGWATTPDAKKPDIVEGMILCSELPEEIYAVYDEKITVTFDANGGYLIGNPNITTYTSVRSKNHIFYGLSAGHEDKRMVPLAWIDQKGVEIPYTPDFYADYTFDGDTTLKAIWGYKIIVDANGGCFFEDPDTTALSIVFEYEGTFDGSVITRLVDDPTREGYILKGYATTPDATEPDVVDLKTPIKGLERIYCVWEKDTSTNFQSVNSLHLKAE